jgi:hypothetical protein
MRTTHIVQTWLTNTTVYGIVCEAVRRSYLGVPCWRLRVFGALAGLEKPARVEALVGKVREVLRR